MYRVESFMASPHLLELLQKYIRNVIPYRAQAKI